MDNKIRIYFLYSCKKNELPFLQDFKINYNTWLGLKEEKISFTSIIKYKLNFEYTLLLICFTLDEKIYKKLPNNFYIQLETKKSNYRSTPLDVNNKLKYNIEFFFQVQFLPDKLNDLPLKSLNISLYEEIDYYFCIKKNEIIKEKNFLSALIDYFKNLYQNDLKLYFTILGNIIETKKDDLLLQFFEYNFNFNQYLQSNINTFEKIKEIIEYLNTNRIFNLLNQKNKEYLNNYYYIIYGYLYYNDKQKAFNFY